MLNKTIKAFFWIAAFFLAIPAFTQSTDTEELLGQEILSVEGNIENEGIDMTEVIMHHIADGHEFHIFTYNDEDVSIPLPIILLDEGLQVFSSNKFFKEGTLKTEVIDGNTEEYLVNESLGYGIYNEKIYKLNGSGKIEFDTDGTVVSAKPLDFSITKNVFTLFFSALLLFWLATATVKAYGKGEVQAPKGVARFMEPLVLFVRDDIAKPNIGEDKYKKYLPYLLSAFFFIFLNALLGLVPVFPGGTNLVGNISFTLMLALVTLIITVFSGNKNYWRHILATPGVPIPLLLIIVPIELIGILTKPFALTIRLFANMTAGHIVILSLVGIIFTFQSVAWAGLSVPLTLFIYVLKLLVAFLQAFIFTMLSALFIGEAVAVAEH